MVGAARKAKYLPALLATVGLFCAAATPTQAASGPQRNVPRWIDGAPKVASSPDGQRVTIAAYLSFRNQAALEELVAAQSTPGSASYGKYLTPDQFHAQFSPPAADVARVQDALRQLGFQVDFTPDSGIFVEASGTVAQVKAAFGISQDVYSYKGRSLRANAETPNLPASIADIVRYVAGLDDSATLRQPSHLRREGRAAAEAAVSAGAAASPSAPPPTAADIASPFCSKYWGDLSAKLSTAPGPYAQYLPWLICGYTPGQVRAAYGVDDVPQDGSGVRVGIVDVYASPTIVQDASHYSTNHGLPPLTARNFRQIVPAGLFDVPATDPCGPQGWYEEETLDVEAVHTMAPGAFILFTGDTCTDPVNSPLYDLIDHHRVDIVTNSYSYNGEGLPDDFIASENQYFLQAACEGMSLLFSTGDDGDLAAINGFASGTWDSTSAWVTAVGGTSLALFNHSGAKKEWGWGTYRAFLSGVTESADGLNVTTTGAELPFTFYSGSGGGPSTIIPAPFYQAAVPYSLSGFTTLADGTVVPLGAAYRVTPDISMVGDPYTGFLTGETYTIAGDPLFDSTCTPLSSTTEYCEFPIGGTSLSSPLFAGVLALANQARFQHGKGPVGFVNPALYRLQRGPIGSGAPLFDIDKPDRPTAVLRGYVTDPTELRVVTINSVPNPTPGAAPAVVEGADTSYLTTRGYDEVTGLGVPNVPALINALKFF
jgi:subtilase family serine protease